MDGEVGKGAEETIGVSAATIGVNEETDRANGSTLDIRSSGGSHAER